MAGLLIGRWQPLHPGHCALIRKALELYGEVVVGCRNTGIDDDNPYSFLERLEMFRNAFHDEMSSGKLMVIDLHKDVTHVVHGRRVGWEVVELKLNPEIENISGTAIRSSSSEGET